MTEENKTPYDSTADTQKHIARVAELLNKSAQDLIHRGAIHDMSKLIEPEKSGFDACIPKLANLKYGSEEYRAALREIKPTLTHHYAQNAHHPEHYEPVVLTESHPLNYVTARTGLLDIPAEDQTPDEAAAFEYLHQLRKVESAQVNRMNLFSVVEMLMDWKAATERMQDGGDIRKSIEINTKRFGLSTQLAELMRNTVEYMGW